MLFLVLFINNIQYPDSILNLCQCKCLVFFLFVFLLNKLDFSKFGISLPFVIQCNYEKRNFYTDLSEINNRCKMNELTFFFCEQPVLKLIEVAHCNIFSNPNSFI